MRILKPETRPFSKHFIRNEYCFRPGFPLNSDVLDMFSQMIIVFFLLLR